MEKTQTYLPSEELAELRKAAARSGRSAADLIREAIRKQMPRSPVMGPIALWMASRSEHRSTTTASMTTSDAAG
jgi:hypothetical protein